MRKNDDELIKDIISYCIKIENILSEIDYDYDIYITNEIYQLSTSMCIIQIGEYVNRLSDDFKNNNDHIPWNSIKGLRNVATHKYDHVDYVILWNTLTESVPELKQELIQL